MTVASVILIAEDQVDAPSVAGTTIDITDLYALGGDNPNNTVFIATVQGPLSPEETGSATFDEDVLIEFNIDNTGYFVEDLVIQAIKRGDSICFFGLEIVVASETGLNSNVQTDALRTAVKISTSADVQIASNNGVIAYAGPIRDGFFLILIDLIWRCLEQLHHKVFHHWIKLQIFYQT
jgi:hypothetical protein